MLWLTMKTLEQGAAQSPRKPPGENLSLIDSISYLLLATELDKDVVQSYLATLATPNQLIQLTMCCSQAQLETAAKPASKAAADKGNTARLDATTATSSASASASELEKLQRLRLQLLRGAGLMNPWIPATSVRISTLRR